jgi:pilus assembly protein CpaB
VTRRRRAAALLGLALILGALAASDVAGREAALRREVGPPVPVVVLRAAVGAGDRLRPSALAVRQVPARYAPAGAYRSPGDVAGQRAAVAISAGVDLDPSLVDDGTGAATPAGPPLRAGQRVAQIVAVGTPEAIVPGSRVDVLVTQEGRTGEAGTTTLALEDTEVLAVAPAQASTSSDVLLPRVSLDLRVSLRQAVYLAAAQSFARELRVLPRAAADHRRGGQGLRVDGRAL